MVRISRHAEKHAKTRHGKRILRKETKQMIDEALEARGGKK
jgi:hypothetical protein